VPAWPAGLLTPVPLLSFLPPTPTLPCCLNSLTRRRPLSLCDFLVNATRTRTHTHSHTQVSADREVAGGAEGTEVSGHLVALLCEVRCLSCASCVRVMRLLAPRAGKEKLAGRLWRLRLCFWRLLPACAYMCWDQGRVECMCEHVECKHVE
jgi:hypothetical protein